MTKREHAADDTGKMTTEGPSASSDSTVTGFENFCEVIAAMEGWTEPLVILPKLESIQVERQLTQNPYIRLKPVFHIAF